MKGGGSSRLKVEIDGAPLPDAEARELWARSVPTWKRTLTTSPASPERRLRQRRAALRRVARSSSSAAPDRGARASSTTVLDQGASWTG